MSDSEQSNVVPLFGRREAEDKPMQKEFDRITVILTWAGEMRRAGHMPDHVAKAFHDHFTGEPEDVTDGPSL